MVKKSLALVLISQIFVCHTTDSVIVATPQVAVKSPSNTQTYQSPSVETIKADKEFCLTTLRNPEADVNALSPSGKTPLQLLTLYFINNFETRQLMALALKRGANVNIIDEQGRTPLFFVVAYALCPEVFGEKQKALDDASNAAQQVPALQTTEVPLDDAVATTNAGTSQEQSTVQTEQGTTQGAVPTKPMRNPLHDKAVSMEVIEMFLAHKADPTHTDHQGISPLLLAITMGSQEMIDLFARYGLLEKIFADQQEQTTENPEVVQETTQPDDATASDQTVSPQA